MPEQRYKVNINYGLSAGEVEKRNADGLKNYDVSMPTKTTGKIFFDNIVTLFNIINVVLAVAVLYTGSYKNALFMGIVLANTAIGIFQELRAKRAVDKLSIIGCSKARVIRDGKESEIGIHDIVLDDVLKLGAGDQIPCDCIVRGGECDVNEALITGESDNIHKCSADVLLSGSYIVSGSVIAVADKVGENCYATQIFKDSKYIKKPNSEIMKTINRIILILSFAIIPVGTLLFFSQYGLDGNTFEKAVVNSVAAIIGMIPEGLVLLTSTVLAVSVIRLSKRKVLVQELYCIETLARVDVLCLDKTGTITEGTLELCDIIPANGYSNEDIEQMLGTIISVLDDNNATSNAIKEKISCNFCGSASVKCPFSSERKWSGVTVDGNTYILGAAEYVLNDTLIRQYNSMSRSIPDSMRTLVLVRGNHPIKNNQVPDDISICAIICIKDKIRSNASQTLSYFKEQGVQLKIISGDSIKTVSNIAKTVGLDGYDNCIDLSKVNDDKELYSAAEKYTIFGRVTPDKKKKLIQAFKALGHTVGMTGDGVNDVPALKEADCSIAMASGSDAARNVAQLVLTDNDFSSMPHVVAEGRRTINNIQRSASLFLMKTLFSSILAISFAFLNYSYPFQPIQMSLISAFTIGIPSFVLALEPNKERIQGKFFRNVLFKALPGALTVSIGVILCAIAQDLFSLSAAQTSTLAVTTTAFTGLMLVYMVSQPLNRLRLSLLLVMSACIVAGIVIFTEFFSLSEFGIKLILLLAFLILYAYLLYTAIGKIMAEISSRYQAHKKRHKIKQ